MTIVTAHPDDTEFYIGGLLLRLSDLGAHLSLIVATDGDKGYYPFANPARLRRIRRAEQSHAAAQWQAQEVVFLGHRDGRLRADEKLVRQIETELRRLDPEYLFLFDVRYPPRLTHQDHLEAGRAAFEAVQRTNAGRWALHFSTRAPNFVADVTDLWPRRRELLRCHPSQWHNRQFDTVSSLITQSALADGRRLGVEYGEGLRCVRLGV